MGRTSKIINTYARPGRLRSEPCYDLRTPIVYLPVPEVRL